MPKTVRQWLEETLEDLTEDELRKFKTNLNEFPVKTGYDNIPRGLLQKADALDLSDLLVNYYTEDYAPEVAAEVLRVSNCRRQADKLVAAALPAGTGKGEGRGCGMPALELRRRAASVGPRSWELRLERSASAVPDRPGDQASGSCDQHFIDQFRKQLIQRTTTVEAVLDQLYGPVLKDEQYQKIYSKDTNQEKMRELYKLVPSWDRFCKDQLYNALKAINPFLVKDLEGR